MGYEHGLGLGITKVITHSLRKSNTKGVANDITLWSGFSNSNSIRGYEMDLGFKLAKPKAQVYPVSVTFEDTKAYDRFREVLETMNHLSPCPLEDCTDCPHVQDMVLIHPTQGKYPYTLCTRALKDIKVLDPTY